MAFQKPALQARRPTVTTPNPVDPLDQATRVTARSSVAQTKGSTTQGWSGYRARRQVADSWGPLLVAGLSPNK
jgi:hypothetical protein